MDYRDLIDLCPLPEGENALHEPFGAPVVTPVEWFFEPPDEWDHGFPHVPMCGPDAGRFAAYVNEHDKNAHTTPGWFPPRGLDFSYHNLRPHRAVDRDGNYVMVRAGLVGFKHSPDELQTLADLQRYHHGVDTAGAEVVERQMTPEDFDELHNSPPRGLIRARAVENDRGVLLLGAVQPWVTRREAILMNQSHVSGEWLDYGNGNVVYVAAALVSQPAYPLAQRDELVPDLVAASKSVPAVMRQTIVIRKESYMSEETKKPIVITGSAELIDRVRLVDTGGEERVVAGHTSIDLGAVLQQAAVSPAADSEPAVKQDMMIDATAMKAVLDEFAEAHTATLDALTGRLDAIDGAVARLIEGNGSDIEELELTSAE